MTDWSGFDLYKDQNEEDSDDSWLNQYPAAPEQPQRVSGSSDDSWLDQYPVADVEGETNPNLITRGLDAAENAANNLFSQDSMGANPLTAVPHVLNEVAGDFREKYLGTGSGLTRAFGRGTTDAASMAVTSVGTAEAKRELTLNDRVFDEINLGQERIKFIDQTIAEQGDSPDLQQAREQARIATARNLRNIAGFQLGTNGERNEQQSVLDLADAFEKGEDITPLLPETFLGPEAERWVAPEERALYRVAERIEEWGNRTFQKKSGEEGFTYDVVQSMPTLLMFMGVSATTGPVGSFSLAALMGQQETYDRGRLAGLSPREAMDRAHKGLLPGAMQAFPAEIILGRIPGLKSVKELQTFWGAVSRVGLAGAGEGLVENAGAIWQNLIDAEVNPDVKWSDGTPYQGLVSGAGAAAIQAAFIAAAKRGATQGMTRKEFETAMKRAAEDAEKGLAFVHEANFQDGSDRSLGVILSDLEASLKEGNEGKALLLEQELEVKLESLGQQFGEETTSAPEIAGRSEVEEDEGLETSQTISGTPSPIDAAQTRGDLTAFDDLVDQEPPVGEQQQQEASTTEGQTLEEIEAAERQVQEQKAAQERTFRVQRNAILQTINEVEAAGFDNEAAPYTESVQQERLKDLRSQLRALERQQKAPQAQTTGKWDLGFSAPVQAESAAPVRPIQPVPGSERRVLRATPEGLQDRGVKFRTEPVQSDVAAQLWKTDTEALQTIAQSSLGGDYSPNRIRPVDASAVRKGSVLLPKGQRVDSEGMTALGGLFESLGHRVVFYRDTGGNGKLPGGATIRGSDGTVYVNVASTVDLMSESSHELVHQMRVRYQDAYKTYLNALQATTVDGKPVLDTSDEAMLAWAPEYTGKKFTSINALIADRARPNESPSQTKDRLVEEMVADATGVASRQPGFWNQVFETMGRQDKTALQKFVDVLTQMIDAMKSASFQGIQPHINDMVALRDAAAQFLASGGTFRPAQGTRQQQSAILGFDGNTRGKTDVQQGRAEGPATDAASRRGTTEEGTDRQDAVAGRSEPRTAEFGIVSDIASSLRRGEGKAGEVSLVGVHYSKQPRTELRGEFYGQGMLGEERQRVMSSTDERLKSRVYVYVNEGQGVAPESGVGSNAHAVPLENLYDVQADPHLLWWTSNGNLNTLETSILDLGYDGLYSRAAFRTQGVAYVMGPAAESIMTQPVDSLEPGVTEISDTPSPYPGVEDTAARITGLRGRPGIWGGKVEGARWRDAIARNDPDLAFQMNDLGVFDTDELMYLDDLARAYVMADVANRDAESRADIAESTSRVPARERLRVKVRNEALDLSNIDILYNPDYKAPAANSQTKSQVAYALHSRGVETLKRLGIDVADLSNPELQQIVAESIAAEIDLAMQETGHAATWYSDKIIGMMGVASLIHPELKSDPGAQAAFLMAVAITSQNSDVVSNIQHAEEVYAVLRKNKGKFVPKGWGTASGQMRKNFRRANELFKQYTPDQIIRFLNTEFTVGELKRAGWTVAGELAEQKVYGSAIFGPKIGNGFYQNINGNFSPLTMDMWFMRAMGRLTGDLMEGSQDLIARQTERFLAEIDSGGAFSDGRTVDWFKEVEPRGDQDLGITEFTPENVKGDYDVMLEMAHRINAWFTKNYTDNRDKYDNKKYVKPQIVLAAQQLLANANPKDAPQNGKHRVLLRETFARALSLLKDAGVDLSSADGQALWWFPEKDLYGKMGYRVTRAKPTDYEQEMRKLARERGHSEATIQRSIRNARERARRNARRVAGKGRGTEATDRPSLTRRERNSFLARRVIGRERRTLSYTRKKPRTARTGPTVAGRRLPADVHQIAKQATRNALNQIGVTTPEIFELHSSQEAAQAFVEAITEAKSATPTGAAVSVYSAEEYAGMRMFVTEDGQAGFALNGDDIISVFNTQGSQHKGWVVPTLLIATQQGGRRLDAFDIGLPEAYSQVGFRAVSRIPWSNEAAPDTWDYNYFEKKLGIPEGRPDVVFMVFDPAHSKNYQPGDGRVFRGDDSYGKAAARQEREAKKVKSVDQSEFPEFSPQRSPLGFYSALAKAVQQAPAKLDSAKAGQWKVWIQANAGKLGVKADEIQWSGVLDYLDMQDGPVSSADIQNYLEQGGVQVEEVVLGYSSQPFDTGQEAMQYIANRLEITVDQVREMWPRTNDSDYIALAKEFAEKADQSSDARPAKFSEYAIPGGTNYREVLLTLPQSPDVARLEQEREALNATSSRDPSYVELTSRIKAAQYQSSHWTETPNVLAHLRVDDRTGPNGEKILFVQEVQSDWGQQGRRDGFVEKGEIPAGWELIDTAAEDRADGFPVPDGQVGPWRYKGPDVSSRVYENREEALANLRREAYQNSIPSAPFVTDTKGWVSLALKRALIMAAEGGYDQVAFVNGEQAAELYSLDTRLSEISYRLVPNDHGLGRAERDVYSIEVVDISGHVVWDASKMYYADEIEATLGKEIAQKIVDGVGEPGTQQGVIGEPKPTGRTVLKGDNLKIEAKGMRDFYDRIVPQVANKILKPFGQKVGAVGLNTPRPAHQSVPGFLVRAANDAFNEGVSREDAIETMMRVYELEPHQDVMEAVNARYDDVRNQQPAITITPEMRQTIGDDGLPMFSNPRPPTKVSEAKAEELEAGEKITLYRAMALIDGKLYPPMSAKMTDGAGKLALRNPEPMGEWQQSEERADLVPTEGPNKGMFPLKKPGGGTTWALYAPYFHASPLPLNDQFTAAYLNDGDGRPQIVTVEVEVPASEQTSGYQAEGSVKSVGMNRWRAGTVASKLPGGREVFLSRYMKIKRIVPDAEVAQKIAGIVNPNRLQIPENVVTPQLREELEKQGVRIAKKGTSGDDIRFSKPRNAAPGQPQVNNRWMEISPLKGFRGIFESVPTVLRDRAVGLDGLATDIEKFYDDWRKHIGTGYGMLFQPLRAIERLPSDQGDHVFNLFERYNAAMENGRSQTAQHIYQNNGQELRDLIDAWDEFAQMSGDMNQAAGVQVYDSSIGGFRPIGKVRRFWPRMLNQEAQDAIDNPTKNDKTWARWNQMVSELIANGNIATADEAAKFIRTYTKRSVDDYFGGLEKARLGQLPESFYDYGIQNGITYIEQWARHISRIEAFGQKTTPDSRTSFDRAVDSTSDKATEQYIRAIEGRVFSENDRTPGNQFLQRANAVATAIHLGNPATASLNLIGGSALNVMAFGFTPTLVGAFEIVTRMMVANPKRAWNTLTANQVAASVRQARTPIKLVGIQARQTWKAFKDLLSLPEDLWTDMVEKGILRSDYMQMQQDMLSMGLEGKGDMLLSKAVSLALKAGGYTPAEYFIRANSALAGRYQLRTALKHWNSNIRGRKSRNALAWFQRNGFDVGKLIREGGQGEESTRYILWASNLTNGTYQIDQTPVWIDTPVGRTLAKYQKFLTQVNRLYQQQFWRPMVASLKGGESVTYTLPNGQTVVDKAGRFKPFMDNLRFFIVPALAYNLLLAPLRENVFGYIDPAPGDDELIELLQDDEYYAAMMLAFEKGWAGILGLGALGMFGNYGQMLYDVADRNRVKSPLDPPALAPLIGIGHLFLRGFDQADKSLEKTDPGRYFSLTARDFEQFFRQQLSAYRTGKALAVSFSDKVGLEWREAQLEVFRRDRAYTKKMTRRYAADAGIFVKRRTQANPGSGPMAPINRAIVEELVLGNPTTARLIAEDHLRSIKDWRQREAAWSSMVSSIRSYEPARLSTNMAPSDLDRDNFLVWVKDRVSPENYERIRRVQDSYLQAAQQAGFREDDMGMKSMKERIRRDTRGQIYDSEGGLDMHVLKLMGIPMN